jgi:hypothetical protein
VELFSLEKNILMKQQQIILMSSRSFGSSGEKALLELFKISSYTKLCRAQAEMRKANTKKLIFRRTVLVPITIIIIVEQDESLIPSRLAFLDR